MQSVKSALSLFCYRLLIFFLMPLVILILLVRSRTQKQYRQRLTERLGFYPQVFKKHGIVVHAASVGEVLALKPFIEQLIEQHPNTPITVTTFTPTGSAQVIKSFDKRVQHCYLPLDFYGSNALFLTALAPQLMVFMETEIWPSLLAQAQQRDVKLLLVNGRLSGKSIGSYQKLTWLITPALNRFNAILAQSEQSLTRFGQLGAPLDRLTLSGNVKYDLALNESVSNKITELEMLLPKDRLVWVVASTHQGDEAIALAAFEQVLIKQPSALLVMVPRHPERFVTVRELSTKFGYSVQMRSTASPVQSNTQVWLLDTLGELLAMYALADVVTMGGSFSDIGGHNPLEPALFEKPIIVGPRMDNFKEISQQLVAEKAMVSLTATDTNNDHMEPHKASGKTYLSQQLAEQVLVLCSNDSPIADGNNELTDSALNNASLATPSNLTNQAAANLGKNAYQVVLANRGATQLSLEKVAQLLQVGE